jgi:PAS domain S-box-containing protein
MRSRLDLGIGGWLGLGFGAVALLLAGMTAVAVLLLGRIAEAERLSSEFLEPRASAAARLERDLLRVAVKARTYGMTADEKHLGAYRAAVESANLSRSILTTFPKAPDGAVLYGDIEAQIVPYLDGADALVRLAERGGTRDALREVESLLTERREALLDSVRQYVLLQEGKAAEASRAIRALQREARRLLLAAAAAALVLLAATAHLVARGVRGPALELVAAARRIARGDYDRAAALAASGASAHRNELAELKRAFGGMALELQDREARISAQNEELQAQQEELQAQNEELQAQQEELQAQNEELNAQSAELESQTSLLRAHEEELQAALARLGASELRYRQLFEHVSEGFSLHEIVRDGDGNPTDYRFVEVNPAFERLTGLSREAILGRTAREVIPGLEPDWGERYAHVAETGTPVRFEAWSAGLGRHYEVVAFSPGRGQFATLFFDVTDRKRAEEALRDADRRKDEFLAVLSHELRNPLGPIVNGLQVIASARAGTEQANRARAIIQRQVAHLVRLVDDLLDVTRISRGKVHLQRTHVDLAALVRQAAEDNASTLAERGVELEIALPARPLWVDADPARLAQIVGNLLQNAAKFTPAGGRVDVVLEEIGPGRAALRVRDTGVGIPPEILDRMFEPFIQGESSLARTPGGLGLGLALVKGLVELHGGTVRAASEGDRRGAEFTVELPLDGVPAGAMEAPARSAVPGRRVLVVEDNADAAESLADLLRLGGHEVEVAHDGAEGLRRALAVRPHVVLCDVGLPGIDGYELARRARAEAVLSGTLLVALTGYALPEDLRRAKEAGFDAHLTKPARPEEIEGVLARVRA